MANRKKKPAAKPRRVGRRQRRTVKPGALSLSSPMRGKLGAVKIGDLYRPMKKPVTLRIDADVIAWFKKDGRRYQTRINQALRKVMEKEMRTGA